MTYNRSAGDSPEELHERAVAALVRVWGVTDREAREAIARAKMREHRLRVKRDPLHAWALDQQRRLAMDLAAFDESVRSARAS